MRYALTDREWNLIQPLPPSKSRGIPRFGDRRIMGRQRRLPRPHGDESRGGEVRSGALQIHFCGQVALIHVPLLCLANGWPTVAVNQHRTKRKEIDGITRNSAGFAGDAYLPKLRVEGPIPFTRSNSLLGCRLAP